MVVRAILGDRVTQLTTSQQHELSCTSQNCERSFIAAGIGVGTTTTSSSSTATTAAATTAKFPSAVQCSGCPGNGNILAGVPCLLTCRFQNHSLVANDAFDNISRGTCRVSVIIPPQKSVRHTGSHSFSWQILWRQAKGDKITNNSDFFL